MVEEKCVVTFGCTAERVDEGIVAGNLDVLQGERLRRNCGAKLDVQQC